MRNTILRIVYAIGVFIVTVVLLELFTNHDSTQTTAEMSDAVLPVVSMQNGSTVFNALPGFTERRDPGQYRAPVSPVGPDRTVHFAVNTYGRKVISLSFEVRDLTGTRLFEKGRIEPLPAPDNNTLETSVTFQNLISTGQEYLLVLLVSTQDAQDITYYTRFYYSEDETAAAGAMDAVAFAQRFHESTVTGQDRENVEPYIEPDDTLPDTDYSRVSIHSSYEMITYGQLAPNEVMPGVFTLLSVNGRTYSLSYQCKLAVSADEGISYYDVTEQYRLYRADDRFQLIEYDRQMQQIFDPEAQVYAPDMIELGIGTPQQVMSSDDGETVAFISDGRLYACHTARNRLAVIYSFADADSTDPRENNLMHDMRILRVGEGGNVEFLVYGYMNRGQHEGRTGVAEFLYNSEYRTIEEKTFIPFQGSYEVLRAQMERGSYLSPENVLYLTVDDTLYEVDLAGETTRVLEPDLAASGGMESYEGRMIARLETTEGKATGNIVLTDLSDRSQQLIRAEDGEYLSPLGFIGNDLIYGISRNADAVTDAFGDIFCPMYSLRIVSPDLEQLENYDQSPLYISGVDVGESQITIHRVLQSREEASGGLTYQPSTDDQIVSRNEGAQQENPLLASRSDELRLNVTDLAADGLDPDEVRLVLPKEVLYERGREITVVNSGTDRTDRKQERYYIYSLYGFLGCTSDLSDAVLTAQQTDGAVTDARGSTVWWKPVSDEARITSLPEEEVNADPDSVSACLKMIAKLEGSAAEVSPADKRPAKERLLEIADSSIVLDLSGLELAQIECYIERGTPVLAATGRESAVLITGYTPDSITVMDPAAGSIHTLRMDTAEQIFHTSGGKFLCYIHSGADVDSAMP